MRKQNVSNMDFSLAFYTIKYLVVFSSSFNRISSIKVPYTAKLSRGKTFAVVHKTHYSLEIFAVHQVHAIMYCTQQMIQGENFHNWLKNRKNRESFPLESFAVYSMWMSVLVDIT